MLLSRPFQVSAPTSVIAFHEVWRQPAGLASPVVETRSTVTKILAPATTAVGGSLQQGFLDHRSAMHQLDQRQNRNLLVLLPNNCDAIRISSVRN